MGGFPLVPWSPRVSYALLARSGHTTFFTVSRSQSYSLEHFTRSENGRHGLMAALLTATKIRCTCFTTGSNIVDWNVVLPEERDEVGDQQLESPGPGPNSEHACF